MAGQSFPRTLIEFQRRFGTEEASEAYLGDVRWPLGFVCPRCGGTKAWTIATRRLRECAACGRQTSTTAGTILHRTRTDLTPAGRPVLGRRSAVATEVSRAERRQSLTVRQGGLRVRRAAAVFSQHYILWFPDSTG